MLNESCSLEVSEIVLTKHGKLGETEKGMDFATSKDAISSGVLIELVRRESRPCSKSLNARLKKVILTDWLEWEVG